MPGFGIFAAAVLLRRLYVCCARYTVGPDSLLLLRQGLRLWSLRRLSVGFYVLPFCRLRLLASGVCRLRRRLSGFPAQQDHVSAKRYNCSVFCVLDILCLQLYHVSFRPKKHKGVCPDDCDSGGRERIMRSRYTGIAVHIRRERKYGLYILT